MKDIIFKNVSGACPIVNDEVSVEIEYRWVPAIGSISRQYKATSVDCDYSDRCTERFCSIASDNLTIDL